MTGPDIGDVRGLEIDLPFAMSSTGGSGFRVAIVFECPRKAALKLLGWRMKKISTPLWFGSVIHKNAFKPYLAPETIQNLPQEAEAQVKAICDAEKITETWTDQKGESHTSETEAEVKDSDRTDLPILARNQMTVWDALKYPASEIRACEKKLASKLIDPESGNVPEEADGVRITGRLDLLHVEPQITDVKTTKQPLKEFWYQHLNYHRQLSTYRYLVMAGLAQRVDVLAFFQLTKHKTAETIRKYATEVVIQKPMRFSRIFREYFGALRALRKCAEQKDWPCNWYACEGKWSPCPFLPLCWWDQYDDANEWQKTLKRKEISG